MKPKEEYIEPDLSKNGRWAYGFGDLEVGDQMRCPIAETETHQRAAVRVHSAAICWKKKNFQEERKHIRFRCSQRSTYILVERVS